MNPAEPKVEGDERYLWGFESKWHHREDHDKSIPPRRRYGTVPFQYHIETGLVFYKGEKTSGLFKNLYREYEKYEENGIIKERVVRDRQGFQVTDSMSKTCLLLLYTREEALKIVLDAFKKQVSDHNSYIKDLFSKVGHI